MTSMTMVQALNAGLRRALENDPKVLLMGEDIGPLGGVFRVTDGLQKADGPELQRRLEVCSLCDQRNDDRCSVCGCYLAEKASWRSSECPLGKWNQKQEVAHVE